MREVTKRIDELKEKLEDPRLLAQKGLGNEIGFYIFDYDPTDELIVREAVPKLKRYLEKRNRTIQLFDLYDIILAFFEQRGYMEKNFQMEAKKGSIEWYDKMKKALKIATDNDWIIQYINEHLEKEAIIFITGVGKAYPIVRSHVVLNNLQTVLENNPLILFYPGTYENGTLSLFNEMTDDHYYRAFKIVED
ncbi:DUF1788 domain-containing protein [Pisciglobus halotolerans]|uniref:DUF1788 domain-containing protein n=1 Tax=Pisciglobus halotolerans TaxID=745365 RepID=A0A1I3ARL1_9LACT|nr:DUF1788 domain-containing protein [Pisciglobus halotolerans]SFH52705.1 protein of unknown function [Pisciglobus halotolerans]